MNPMKREEGELARMRKAFACLAQPAPDDAVVVSQQHAQVIAPLRRAT